MNEQEAIEFYIQAMAETARRFSISEARTFLFGALQIAGDHPAVAPLRQAYQNILNVDQQLELIAGGQMRLQFGMEAA